VSTFNHRSGLMIPVTPAPPAPASYVLNGTDETILRFNDSSDPVVRRMTISSWVKLASEPDADITVMGSFGVSGGTGFGFNPNDNTVNFSGAGGVKLAAAQPITTDGWHHYVVRLDSTDGTAANRLRAYRDGTLITATELVGVTLNAVTGFFANGGILVWGGISPFLPGKLAFLDIVQDLSLDPAAFAFNDSGTWTALKYAGAYGAFGVRLDGTDGFNDVSGNGQHFTGNEMNLTNLDFADLPPFVS
jgi:hypothetical protein